MKRCLFLSLCILFAFREVPLESSLYFSPQTDISAVFIEKVKAEGKSIKLISYRLLNPRVIQALLEARRRGLFVEVIVDQISVTKNTPLKALLEEGVSVFVWSPKSKQRMKYGFCIFGSASSWTGSFSLSLKSEFKPFENALFLEDEKVAARYLEEFERIKKKDVISFSQCFKRKGFSL